METFVTVRETQKYLRKLRKNGKSIGFVPTMGALHEGHLMLIRRAKAENDIAVCSIFVNPIQFNNKEDLVKYPRMPAEDLKLLEIANCDVIFSPTEEEMYPDGLEISVDIDLDVLGKVMEGKFRPGHFNGVVIAVKRLFDIVEPTRSYFGKKDYQQLAIIKHMVKMLKIPLVIVSCDTVRETDGLAMSSRNLRLSSGERMIAPHIFQVLNHVREMAGSVPIEELKSWAIRKIQEKPEIRVEYFEIGDKETLHPLEDWSSLDRAVAFTAVFLGNVRLIDNIELFS